MKTKLFYAIRLMAIFWVPISQSAEWSLTATARPSVKHIDNIFMAEDETSETIYTVSPTATISREQENSNAALSFGYLINRYKSLRFLNQDNPFVRFSSGYQTERSNWGLSADFNESSSRNSVLADTGDFTTESTVTTKTLSPSFSYQLTERDSVSLGGSALQRTFSTADFSDTESLTLNTGWQHQFTERFNGGLNVSITESESKGLSNFTENTNYNTSVSLNYELSEIWSMGGNIGIRQLESEQNNLGLVTKSSASGSSFNLNASRQTELDTLSINTSRSVTASSGGGVNETTQVNISWSRELSEILTASVNTSYQQTISAVDDTGDKRENIDFSPSIRWRLSPNMGLDFGYNYRQQKESQNGSNVSSNAVTVTLNYDWDGIRVSR